MRLNPFTALFGLATATVVAASPVQAAPVTYQIGSGTTSLRLDSTALSSLESLGLKFRNAFETTQAATGFDLGFGIKPETDFSFSFDSATQAFAPLSGTIQHSGGIGFEVDEQKLSLFSPLEIGDFEIGFDNGFFLRDTLTTGLRLFDLVPTSAPTLAQGTLTVPAFEVRVAGEFNSALSNAALLTPDASGNVDLGLTGVRLGTARLVAETVPEPGVVLGLLAAAGTAFIAKRRTAN